MTPGRDGIRDGRLELGDVRPADADARDARLLEDVDHAGRVVERQVVERGDHAVVDQLPGAVDLAVGVALAVTHVGLELGLGGPDTTALVERGDRRNQRVLQLRARCQGPGQRGDHADLDHRGGGARLRADAEAAVNGIATAATRAPSTARRARERTPIRSCRPMVPPTVTTAARGPGTPTGAPYERRRRDVKDAEDRATRLF